MIEATTVVWANNEFSGAELGDKRRAKRAARIAAGLVNCVGTAMSASCGGGGSQAVSRFFDCEEVTVNSVLSGHRKEIGVRAMKQPGRILVAQDTTVLDFKDRKNIKELGYTCANGGNGIMMHSLFVVSEQKLPLGVLNINLWTRDEENRGIKHKRKNRLILEKESHKWLWGLQQVSKHLSELGKEVLVIGDRESDIYELFAHERPSNVHLLVRIMQDRKVEVEAEKTKMYAALDASPLQGTYDLYVVDDKRTATLEVRSCRLDVCAPQAYKGINARSVSMWAVDIREVDAPADVEPLHWRLLSTLEAGSLESSLYLADCYTGRWGIEEFHRVIKDGCKVERLQFENLSRLCPAIAMLSIVAQQVMYLMKYSRTYPDEPAICISTIDEQETVEDWVQIYRYKDYKVVTVADYVRGIAFIGGFRGRKHDGQPGTKAIWEGLRNFNHLLAGRKLEQRRTART